MAGNLELPYMNCEELEDFLAENRAESEITSNEELFLRIRRRRMSVGIHTQRNEDTGLRIPPRGTRPHIKLTLLGSEKFTYHSDTMRRLPPLSSQHPQGTLTPPTPLTPDSVPDLIPRVLEYTTLDGYQRTAEVTLWHVPCSEEDSLIRSLFYSSTSVFVVFFSIASRESFDAVMNMWIPEIQACTFSTPEPPIVLIGTHAELRESLPDKSLISSEEAVGCARSCGASKYVEIFSENVHHVLEIVQQSIQALLVAHKVRDLNQIENQSSLLDEGVFHEHLTLPSPQPHFDLDTHLFYLADVSTEMLQNSPDLYYFVYFDHSDTPITYEKPIKLTHPMPRIIHVRAYARCRYPSQKVTADVPGITPSPMGHFDAVSCTFSLISEAEVTYRYTVDGSKPCRENGRVYTGPIALLHGPLSHGIVMSSGTGGNFTTSVVLPTSHGAASLGPGLGGSLPDNLVIRVVATKDKCFRSSIVDFHPPPPLDPPHVTYQMSEGILSIQTMPHLEYRYTLDGTVPTYDTQHNPGCYVYTQPVLIPKEKCTPASNPRIRVLVFPRRHLPSRIVDVLLVTAHSVSQAPHSTLHQGSSHTSATSPVSCVTLNKSTLQRIQLGQAHRNGSDPTRISRSSHSRPNNRVNSRSPSQTASNLGTPRACPTQIIGRTLANMALSHETRSSTPTSAFLRNRRVVRSASPGTKPNGTPGGGDQVRKIRSPSLSGSTQRAQGKAHENSIDFEFPIPIQLSHLTVTTPGSGMGPEMYEIYVSTEPSTVPHNLKDVSYICVGSGLLDDKAGIQRMMLHPTATMHIKRVYQVKCTFRNRRTASEYDHQELDIRDLKVHGKLCNKSN